MITYKLTQDPKVVIKNGNVIIPEGSREWTLYQQALVDGAIPAPADTVTPPANWTAFNATFLSEPNWAAIALLFSTPDIRNGIVAAAANANKEALQAAYGLAIADLTAQNIPIEQSVLDGWQAIANTNNVPITF